MQMNTVWIVMGGKDWEGSKIIAIYNSETAAETRKNRFVARGFDGLSEYPDGSRYDHVWVDTHKVQSIVLPAETE
mgnify:CR=1 FL=1|tara:strand:- start:1286 stop:1510 length:225 start_codon:yes stop_codon:yes gene_type:complete